MRIIHQSSIGAYLALDSEPVVITRAKVRQLGLAKVVIVERRSSDKTQ